MILKYLTVITNKKQPDRLYYYVDIELAKAYPSKPKDFVKQFSEHFPEKIREDILGALDKQWDFVIDLEKRELIKLVNQKDLDDIMPKVNAREAEKYTLKSKVSVFDAIRENFGYGKYLN